MNPETIQDDIFNLLNELEKKLEPIVKAETTEPEYREEVVPDAIPEVSMSGINELTNWKTVARRNEHIYCVEVLGSQGGIASKKIKEEDKLLAPILFDRKAAMTAYSFAYEIRGRIRKFANFFKELERKGIIEKLSDSAIYISEKIDAAKLLGIKPAPKDNFIAVVCGNNQEFESFLRPISKVLRHKFVNLRTEPKGNIKFEEIILFGNYRTNPLYNKYGLNIRKMFTKPKERN
jgi:hypothetical protein